MDGWGCKREAVLGKQEDRAERRPCDIFTCHHLQVAYPLSVKSLIHSLEKLGTQNNGTLIDFLFIYSFIHLKSV